MRISDWSSDVCSSDLLMPLWLDFLTTPMAAPETCGLRRLRYGWQALCLTLAASIVAQGELRELVGRLAPAATGVLLAAAVMTTILYLGAKHRADTAFLDIPREIGRAACRERVSPYV